jgi:hypothetical protein
MHSVGAEGAGAKKHTAVTQCPLYSRALGGLYD